jgi:UDP-N-acetylglucosamine 3-dehydrogenase
MGLRHARVFAALGHRFEVAGVYDVRTDTRIPDYAPRLRSEEEAIARADVVVVATPTEAHAGAVSRALSAGRHVLVEKPLCATGAEARALAAMSAPGGARLFVGHSERFNPVIRVLARLTRDDQVLGIDLLREGPSRWSQCGVLVNLGVHDFDLAAYLGEPPLTLQASLGSEGGNRARVLFTMTGGSVGHLCVDGSAVTRRRSIALATPQWLFEGDLLAHRLVRTPRKSGTPAEVALPLEEPLAAQATALADALDGASPREIASGEDGAAAIELAEAAGLSASMDVTAASASPSSLPWSSCSP